MKYPVRRFKSLAVGLKELEPFVRDGEHLQTGKEFKRFGGLRSRELLGNWLLCVTLNFHQRFDSMTLTTDPLGGDGMIYDAQDEIAQPTEHVMVPRLRGGNATDELETRILKAIAAKQDKGGAAYASGKWLIVFLNAGENRPWYPNRVSRLLPDALDFGQVWVVGLQRVSEAGEYDYSVSLLNRDGNSSMWGVLVSKDFDAWTVRQVQ